MVYSHKDIYRQPRNPGRIFQVDAMLDGVPVSAEGGRRKILKTLAGWGDRASGLRFSERLKANWAARPKLIEVTLEEIKRCA